MRAKLAGLFATALAIAACGGGSAGSSAAPQNRPPVANAGVDQFVSEFTTVTLDGSGSSDPDNDSISYRWEQLSGEDVSLSSLTAVMPTFDAPDISAANSPASFRFRLTVSDGQLSDSSEVVVEVRDGLAAVSVSGTVSYEFVPATHNNNTCFGLDFDRTTVMPIRRATVQLLDAGNALLLSTTSGDDGSYAFDDVPANTDVRVRVRAELKRSGSPAWDVEVRDNVDTSPDPPPLNTRPLYVVQWPLFDTGNANVSDANFVAETGWDGSAYSGTRAAAPFAILDAVYTGMQLVLSVDPTAAFAPLDVFWSVNNTKTSGSPTDIDRGELGGSFYRGELDSLFLVGDAAVDTGEFDNYVTLHEWGHYFEDNLSRSDSIGGTHFIGGVVEARVAFGEGWGTAMAAIALGDPMACNTGAASGDGSWGFNVETFNGGPQGWYNEISIAGLIFDLFDTANDGADNASIGFAPIYDVMTGPQVGTEAFTTLFSFATLLRPSLAPFEQAFLDALLAAENIETGGLDIWAGSQASVNLAPNNARDVMPLYTDYAADGSVLSICANSDHDPDGDGNKPAEHRYLRISTNQSASYDVRIVPNPPPPPTSDPMPDTVRDRSDPDIYIYRNGVEVASGRSGVDDLEAFRTPQLPAGTYVAALEEWRFGDDEKSSDYPDRICFDVTMTAR